MGFFDFFNKNKGNHQEPATTKPATDEDITRFEKEILRSIARYLCLPKTNMDLETDIYPLSDAFPDQFNEWRTVNSLPDRRCIIYTVLDQMIGHKLAPWQWIERHIDARNIPAALHVMEETALDFDDRNSLKEPNFYSALAKLFFILEDYKASEENCKKAFELDPSHIRTLRVWADLLYLKKDEKGALDIYKQLIKTNAPNGETKDQNIDDILGFSGDIINSPIYACQWLRTSPNATQEIWDWASDEFYYSPHFRAQQAYHLVKQKEYLKALTKLIVLFDEMPWYSEAALNSLELINKLNLSDTLKNEKARIAEAIQRNNWVKTN